MEAGLTFGLQALLPRVVLYAILGTWIAWLYHLMHPAIEAALSPDYRSFSWVGGSRGVGSFLKSTWNVAFRSRELFAEVHRKVSSPRDRNPREVRCH
jgi:hypothetical protein